MEPIHVNRPGDVDNQLQTLLGSGYTIGRELGGGGMSRVFVAHEVALGREVVVKVLPPDMAASVSSDRFRREVQMAAKLQHPHIVPLLTAGASDLLLYYTMPLIEGESLRHRLERGMPFSSSEAARTWREIIDALAYAHAHGVVHRDIKPENILLSGRHAFVTDFGIARAVEAATAHEMRMTATGLSMGTPAYMSPEQAAGDHDVDQRADIYSAGLVMYEMLSGGMPFSGHTLRELAVAHLTKEPAPLLPRDKGCPRALIALVMRCLAKDPANRPQTAEAILSELDTLITPVAQPAVLVQRSKRRRALMVGGLTALVAAIAAATWGAKTNRLPFMTASKPAHDSLRMVVVIAENKFELLDSTLANGYADAVAAEVSKDPWVLVIDQKRMLLTGALQGFLPSSLTRDTIVYIAKRARTSAYLSLAVSRAGTGYILSAEPRGARDDNSLGVIHEAVNSAAEVPAAIARISGTLRKLLVASRDALPFTLASGVLADVKPRAIKFYMEAAGEGEKKNFVEAAKLYRMAVDEDSTFAEAWWHLSNNLANSGTAPADRIAAISHAYHMRSSVRSPAIRLNIAGDYWKAVGRPDSAIASWDSLIKLLPNSDRVGINDQALAFTMLRRYDLAKQVYRNAMDTSYQTLSLVNLNLVSALLQEGRVDDARAEVARMKRTDSSNVNTLGANASLTAATRAWDDYAALGQHWMTTSGLSAQRRQMSYVSLAAVNRGQLAEYTSLSKKSSEMLGKQAVGPFVENAIARARVAVNVEGNPAHGRAMVDSILSEIPWQSIDPLDRPYSSIITTLAQSGDVKTAQVYSDEWSRVRLPEYRMIDSLDVVAARGEIALAAGNGREALRLFRIADVRGCAVCFYPKYARAYDLLKMPDSSIFWFEKYAKATFSPNSNSDAYELARTYRRLGQLYDDRHDAAKAIEYFTALTTLWEHADAVLQPTVRDIKARVSELKASRR